jgi:hypothetical protein
MPRWIDRPALDRFAEKCAFDPVTGCVMWVGGTTSGHGHNQPYGAFWFEGRRWFAHRWAVLHIHGFEIEDLQVDHCCPCGPSTLCVEHVKVVTSAENRELQTIRKDHRCAQNPLTRQHWLLVTRGFEQYEAPKREILDIPWFDPPRWLHPYLLERELVT